MAGRPPVAAISDDDLSKAARLCAEYRRLHGLTQMAMAVRLHTQAYMISNIERDSGDRSTRVVAAILELCEAAETAPDYAGEEAPETPPDRARRFI